VVVESTSTAAGWVMETVTTLTWVDFRVVKTVVVMTRGGIPPAPPPPPRVMVTALVSVMVATEVSVTVEVSTTLAVLVTVKVGLPEKPLVLASLMTLDEIEATSVTGQTVSVSTIVSVTRTVERASAGRRERSAALVGQLVMVGAHEVTVRMSVVKTVRVVKPAAAAVVAVALGAMENVLFETPADRGIADEAAALEATELDAMELEATDAEAPEAETARLTAEGTTEGSSEAALLMRAVPFWRRKCMWRGWE
jgi:hypothetical protein